MIHMVIICIICDRFGKTDHNVTIVITRNANLSHGSLMLDCSHAGITLASVS